VAEGGSSGGPCPLAGADRDRTADEVDVLDAQAYGFEKAEPGAVKQPRDETRDALKSAEDGFDLGAVEYHGQVNARLRAHEGVEPRQIDAEHVPVEEQQRGQSLVLRCWGTAFGDGKVRQERRDFDGAKVTGVAQTMEAHVAVEPVQVDLLGARAVAAGAQGCDQTVRETRFAHAHYVQQALPRLPRIWNLRLRRLAPIRRDRVGMPSGAPILQQAATHVCRVLRGASRR